jgi:hypothetical protein
MKIPTSILFILILAILTSLFNIYDVWSTLTGLSMGALENNPLFNGNYLFKLSAVPLLFVITMAIWGWIDRRKESWTPNDIRDAIKSKKLMSCLWIALTIGYGILVINNTIVLLKVMETVRV